MNPREHRTRNPEPSLDEVRREAYLLWQQEGCPSGRELDHWLAAKEIVRRRAVPPKSDPELDPIVRPTESLVESR